MPTIRFPVFSFKISSEAAEGLLKPASDIRLAVSSSAFRSDEGRLSTSCFELEDVDPLLESGALWLLLPHPPLLKPNPKLSEVFRENLFGGVCDFFRFARGSVISFRAAFPLLPPLPLPLTEPLWDELSDERLPVESGVVDCRGRYSRSVRSGVGLLVPLLASMLSLRVSCANLRISGSRSYPKFDLECRKKDKNAYQCVCVAYIYLRRKFKRYYYHIVVLYLDPRSKNRYFYLYYLYNKYILVVVLLKDFSFLLFTISFIEWSVNMLTREN